MVTVGSKASGQIGALNAPGKRGITKPKPCQGLGAKAWVSYPVGSLRLLEPGLSQDSSHNNPRVDDNSPLIGRVYTINSSRTSQDSTSRTEK